MNKDIYDSPESNIEIDSDIKSITLLYSPTQVACGTIGGPVGLIYFLAKNFEALGKHVEKKRTIIIGAISIFILALSIPFLPESIPGTPFTIGYILIGRFVAEKYQMTKIQIVESEHHEFQSNWKVLGLGFLGLVGTAIIILVPMFLFVMTGVIQ